MSAVRILNSVGRICDFYMLCRFASLDVVCDELNDCAWNLGV